MLENLAEECFQTTSDRIDISLVGQVNGLISVAALLKKTANNVDRVLGPPNAVDAILVKPSPLHLLDAPDHDKRDRLGGVHGL